MSEEVEVVSASSDAAFAAFYEAHRPGVVGTVYALTGDWARAEDLAQDVFVSAHRHWARLQSHPRPDLWVRRAAINRSTSLFRRRRTEQHALARTAARAEATAGHSTTSADADGELAWLLGHIRRLPRQQAHALVLVHVEQLTNPEAAQVLRCSESTLRTHLQRGRTALRTLIEEDRDHA